MFAVSLASSDARTYVFGCGCRGLLLAVLVIMMAVCVWGGVRVSAWGCAGGAANQHNAPQVIPLVPQPVITYIKLIGLVPSPHPSHPPHPPLPVCLPPSLLLALPSVVESFVCRFFIGDINVTLITIIARFLGARNLAALCCSVTCFNKSCFRAPSTPPRRYSCQWVHAYRYYRRLKRSSILCDHFMFKKRFKWQVCWPASKNKE